MLPQIRAYCTDASESMRIPNNPRRAKSIWLKKGWTFWTDTEKDCDHPGSTPLWHLPASAPRINR